MSWIFASLPLLIFIVITWWFIGYIITRQLFRLNDGLSVFVLSMPCGMLTYLLFVNALSYFIATPITTWIVNISVWVIILFLLRINRLPLEWEITYRTRMLLGAASLVLLVFVFLLVAREIWGDTASHATMVNLLANGQFPMRFQCNPAELAAYQYGGDLLAATSTITAGIPPWNGLHVVIACTVYSVACLVFLLAWRRSKSIIAGLLSIFIIFTVTHFVWLLLPLTSGGLSVLIDNSPQMAGFSSVLASMLENPWKFAVIPPGIITTNFTHSLRSVSWGFGPFLTLLFLALVDTPFSNRRVKSLVLAYVIGTVSLLQPASLIFIAFGLGTFTGLHLVFRKNFPIPDFNPWIVITVGILIAVMQGGVITDGVKSILEGIKNETTSFALKPFTLPSCQPGENNLKCTILSISNMGMMPFLLIFLAWDTLRQRKDLAQIMLVFGAFACYILPTIVNYGYETWNFVRVITFASWTLSPFIGVLLYKLLTSGSIPKISIGVAALVVTVYGGVIASWVIIDGRWIGDTLTTDFSSMVPKVDEQMMSESAKLPLNALIFDSVACSDVTASRPGYLFGRYARSSLNRNQYTQPSQGFEAIREQPNAELLRQYGYTDLYVDNDWYNSMSDLGHDAIRFGNFETIAVHGTESDFRILLRVCSADETCIPQLSTLKLSLPYLPISQTFGNEVRLVGYSAIIETAGVRLSLLTEALHPLNKNYHYSLRLIPETDSKKSYPLDGSFSKPSNTWEPGIRNETINIHFDHIPSDHYKLTLRIYDYDSPMFTPLYASSGDVDVVIASNLNIP